MGERTGVLKLLTAGGHLGVRLRIIGVDPGVRNVYVAYSSDGNIITMSLGEYHSLAKTATYGQRLQAVLAKHPVPDLPVVRSPRVADTIAYAAAVAANLDVLQAAYGDRRLREARLTVCLVGAEQRTGTGHTTQSDRMASRSPLLPPPTPPLHLALGPSHSSRRAPLPALGRPALRPGR